MKLSVIIPKGELRGFMFRKFPWLKESMFMCPAIMLSAKIPTVHLSTTETGSMCITLNGQPFQNRSYLFRLVSTIFPKIVAFLNMETLRGKQFKIIYSIVAGVPVFVMDTFSFFKFPSKMLLHYISVMKYSFPIDKNSKISQSCRKYLSFFKHVPIRRNIICFMSKISTSMGLANLARCFSKNMCTTWDSTYFSKSHNLFIAHG